MDTIKKAFTSLFLSSLFLVGCSQASNESKYSIDIPVKSVLSTLNNVYQNGLVYNDGNTAYFLSFDEMQGVPLCNKPNCDHKKNSCISKLVTNENTTPPIIYHDMVYYFSYTDSIVGGEDDKATDYQIESTLKKVDLHTGEIEEVCTFSDMEASSDDSLILSDNMLYFVANNGAVQSDDGTWNYFSTAGRQSICSVNLETGDFQNYGRVNEDEKVATTLFSVGNSTYGINGNVKIDGTNNGKIYMHYYYAVDIDSLLEYFEQYNIFPDSDDDSLWKRENVVFDTNTNKIIMDSADEISAATDDFVIYWNGNNYVQKQKDNVTELENISKQWKVEIYNDTVWFIGEDMKYNEIRNLKTGKNYQLKKEYKDKNIHITAIIDNNYIIQLTDENGTVTFSKLSENELLEIEK